MQHLGIFRIGTFSSPYSLIRENLPYSLELTKDVPRVSLMLVLLSDSLSLIREVPVAHATAFSLQEKLPKPAERLFLVRILKRDGLRVTSENGLKCCV